MLTLTTWLGVVFARILHCKVILSYPLFHTVLSRRKLLHAATLKEWGDMLPLLEGIVSTYVTLNSSAQKIDLFPPPPFVDEQSLIYISMALWVFILSFRL